MGFSRQEYWSGLPCPPPGDLPDLGTEPASLTSSALASGFFIIHATWQGTHGQISFTDSNNDERDRRKVLFVVSFATEYERRGSSINLSPVPT